MSSELSFASSAPEGKLFFLGALAGLAKGAALKGAALKGAALKGAALKGGLKGAAMKGAKLGVKVGSNIPVGGNKDKSQ